MTREHSARLDGLIFLPMQALQEPLADHVTCYISSSLLLEGKI
jgi:hypothetical protein